MLSTKFIEELRAIGVSVSENEPMKSHTSFLIGGPADAYVLPKSEEELTAIVAHCRAQDVPFTVIGNGSNVVFTDKGFRGVVIGTTAMVCGVELISAVDIRCGAGVKLASLCHFACEHSLSGVECLWGIPGSVGGAVYMNAGAYGGEIKDTILSCACLSESGETVTYDAADLDLSYRHSRFAQSQEIVLSATFRLTPSVPTKIRETMDDLMARRRDKQPLDYPSAGSVFKRPNGYYAAALIEECGLKNMAVGGVKVSEKHAGFMVNTGDGTCFDLKRLIEKVQQEVFLATGVSLECEIKMIGEF